MVTGDGNVFLWQRGGAMGGRCNTRNAYCRGLGGYDVTMLARWMGAGCHAISYFCAMARVRSEG